MVLQTIQVSVRIMMMQISNWFYKISTGRVTLATLVIFILFTSLVLPKQSSSVDPSADNIGSPDLSFIYTVDDLYQMAEAYGGNGRTAYIRTRFSFDVIWPIVYGIFLVTTLSWLFDRVFNPGSGWRRLNLIPVFGLILDFLENSSTSLVMFRYPNQTPIIDWLAPIFTSTKWVFVGGSFILLTFGIGLLIYKRFQKHQNMG